MRFLKFVLLGLILSLTGLVPATAKDAPVARIEQVVIETSKGRIPFVAEIADTEQLRSRGLMFRYRMPDNHAMLFDFKQSREVMMWMKNTHISLDMLFIKADGRVVKVAENTTPLSRAIIDSDEPVAFVLEVVAGTASRIGLKPGDRVVHTLMGNASG